MKKLNAFNLTLLMTFVGWVNREQTDLIEYLLEANSILKSKLEKDGKRIRFAERERARLARKGRKVRYSVLFKTKSFLSPDTILRWYNRLIAKKYSTKNPNPTKAKETRRKIIDLVCKLAEENPTWGAGKIAGNLKVLGIKRSKTMIARIMKDNGFDPNPSSGNLRNLTWINFLRSHLHLMACCDFFTKEVWTRAVKEYVEYYNTERPHQGIDNELISPENNKYYKHIEATKNSEEVLSESKWDIPNDPIVKSERLGGLLNFYYRKTG